MEEVIIKGERRDVIGKQVKAFRRQGKLPAVIYGRSIQPISIWMDLKETSHILSRLSPSALVTLEIGSDKHLALVREKQRDYIRGTLKHVDFQVVSMTDKLRVSVSLVIVGESLAVKDFNGVLVEGLDELEVECYPKDLPEKILVDITALKAIGDAIHVRELVLPANVVALDNPEEMVVVVTSQKAEAEPVIAEAAAIEPELIEKGKKEEEEE